MSGAKGETEHRAVYSIPPGVSFLDALARGVLERERGDPLGLARVVILLPTRRACRALQEAFLRQAEARALLLPRMRPLGEVEEEEPSLEEAVAGGEAELTSAIPPLRRRILLTRLILEWAKRRGSDQVSADQGARLAAELAHLLDEVQTERLSFADLDRLAPEEHARHWQITLDFLKLITEHWPAILEEEGFVDPALRRNAALERLARAWRLDPPAHPVIAAGSTGSIHATAELLAVVAGLPRGCVVLPGLDAELDEESWEALEASHPQYGLKVLLERLGLARADVGTWPFGAPADGDPARARLVSQAMRPAAGEGWARAPGLARAALTGLRRLDCPGPREEAGVIALLMREALETEGRRAALITRDRGLARRVGAELRRYDVEVDDSAGRPLAETPPGAFLRLSAELAASRAAPIALLAALKHPLAAGGMPIGGFKEMVRRLERAVLRGPRPAPGFEGLRAALEASPEAAALAGWLDRLEAMAQPFMRLAAARRAEVHRLLAAHVAFAEALAGSDEEAGAGRLWSGEAGEAAAGFVAELLEGTRAMEPVPGASYPALIESLMADHVVRPRYGGHPRLFIWGPLEARLQHVDLMILGGLNEGSWPPEPGADPWMSRPMRREFGLPALERRIGLSAHDFAQCFCAPEVVLTRATKVEGTPTVPSRWLTRLQTVLSAAGLEGLIEQDAMRWLSWHERLHEPARIASPGPPGPRPPVAARPRRLSATEVETWLKDPYAIYARHILKLKPLDPIDADPGAAERGQFIHEALASFVADTPRALPPDALERLIAFGRQAFGPALGRPGVWAFWWPRFLRIAHWFIETERERRREELCTLATEVRGALTLSGPAGAFTLTAKADRIDRAASGELAVVDYKTGRIPSPRQVLNGLSPQLPLEALIAEAGGFEGVPAGPVKELAYWRLSGAEPPGEIKPLDADAAKLAREARKGLERLIAAFDKPSTAYWARPRPEAWPLGSEYDHLARVKEWSALEGGEGP